MDRTEITKKAEELMAAIEKKEGLKEQLLGLQRKAQEEGWSGEEYTEKLLDEIRAAGLEASEEVLSGYIKMTTRVEISPNDLDYVAGGCGNSCNKYKQCPGGGDMCNPYC